MLPEESLRLTAFFGSLGLLYLCAGLLGIRLVIQRRWGRVPLGGERVLRRIVFSLAAAGPLCWAYAALVEPYWLSVTHVAVSVENWQGPPLRIVHISDLHSESEPRLEGRLPAAVRAERPDLILFTGDALNSPEGLAVFKSCLAELASIAPTLVVRGNWDVWYWAELDLFGATGALELANSSVVRTIRGNEVWIGGLDVGGEAALGHLVQAAPAGALRVLLHHYPDEVLRASQAGVDLYLAGHTHGGQVALPFYGALVTLSKFGKRFESGLQRVGRTWIYVTRGIGMEGGAAPRVRFFARPELAVIEVRRQG